MRGFSKVVALATAVLLVVVLAGFGGGHNRNFKAELSGDNEVPAVATDTFGKFRATVSKDGTRLKFRMEFKKGVDIFGAAGAHLHCAPAGSNGPVVAFLEASVPGGFDGFGQVRATLSADNIINPVCGATIAELVDSMRAGDVYVNVHSSANPGGEIRGQVTN